MIKIKNISKKFLVKKNIVQALDNVSLEIEENDCFAIVGESGSGKTTLANILLGIYNYDNGSIRQEQYYDYGNLIGKWITYDKNGNIIEERIYEKDEWEEEW